MKISGVGIPVQDQARALAFYTEKLGFVLKDDVPVGEYRWITVTSPENTENLQVSLEPLGFEPAKVFQESLYEAGIPYTAFDSNDLEAEVERLKQRGVIFTRDPSEMENVKVAMFDDTCGNIICLTERTDGK